MTITRNSKTLFATAALLALLSGSAAAYTCTFQEQAACRRALKQCSIDGIDADICESRYNQCLMNAGCPIP